MCGIAGQYSFASNYARIDSDELRRIRDHMTARGPDGSGLWISDDGRVGLAHRRLSILDLSEAGAQPMADETGEIFVTFNGEIYNYPELRSELEGMGCRFSSHCDTEVLLHLYRERGLKMFGALRGMFAFALWDARERRLILARDAFGIKPLYIADDGCSVRFASQVKALLAGGAVKMKPSAAGHVGFLLWGSVPEPYTLYETIRSVRAGHYVVYGDRGLQSQGCFCRIRDVLAEGESEAYRSSEESAGELREVLLDSVRHHLLADVPVGIFLSSGRDSTAIAALASECGGDLRTFTLGFDEFRGTAEDETPLAEAVARQFGFRHITKWITSAELDPERLMSAMDQPSLDGVNSYLIAKFAAEAGFKVALSGLGGDEMFRGYPTFQRIPLAEKWLRKIPRIPALTRILNLILPETKRKYAGVLEYGRSYAGAYLLSRCLNVPWRLKDLLEPSFLLEGWGALDPEVALADSIEGIHSNQGRVSALEMEWYMRNQLLRDIDWASMAHSLEVRVPLVDLSVLKVVARRRSPWSKHDLAMTPLHALPKEVIRKRKTGFCVPTVEWASDKVGLRDGIKLQPWASYLYQQFTKGGGVHTKCGATNSGAGDSVFQGSDISV
jgi:asparagine synthase (glutamine-hydrolysing)